MKNKIISVIMKLDRDKYKGMDPIEAAQCMCDDATKKLINN